MTDVELFAKFLIHELDECIKDARRYAPEAVEALDNVALSLENALMDFEAAKRNGAIDE